MPPRSRKLPDDLLGEAFLRLPSDDPACLLRASLASKRWRRVLADPAFRRRHRELHQTPSVVGFLSNKQGDEDYTSCFVPNNPASGRPAARDLPGRRVLDCRHGRVLLSAPSPLVGTKLNYDLFVWDPLRNEQRCLPRLSPPLTDVTDDRFYAAVLCAAAVEGCDHSICHGGPFRVAFIWIDRRQLYARAYCSETDNWSEAISVQKPQPQPQPGRRPFRVDYTMQMHWRNTLVGDTLYFHCTMKYALEYQLAAQRLSIIEGPPRPVSEICSFFVPTGDGGLGCMGVEEDESSLHLQLWSREAASDSGKVARWTRGRAIDLEELLPNGALPSQRWASRPYSKFRSVSLVGFAEGTDVIFVGTPPRRDHPDAVYMVQLNSGRARKVFDFYTFIFPYTTFCVPVIDASSTSEGPGDNASGAGESQSACAWASQSTITNASSTTEGPGDNASGA